MITEQELELALELKDEIKALKEKIAKLEGATISSNTQLNSGISIDGIKVNVNAYTRDLLIKFKDDAVEAHRAQLEELSKRYKEIIESPADTLRRILEEDG